MTLSQKGILQLQRLSSRLLGLGGVDLAETVERVQTGDTGACLAVMGYLLDATYSSVLLHWMRQHEWFVPFAGTDADFVTQIWRLLREEGLTPAVTVRQFLSPRYAEAKVSILTSFVALLHKKAAALSRTRRGTTPSSSTFSSRAVNSQVEVIRGLRRVPLNHVEIDVLPPHASRIPFLRPQITSTWSGFTAPGIRA
eukprot:Hpha_TRINITY_DN16121_c2_g2::TRINITY_DN16121_c2_g2_i1::g.4211::m.4211